MLQFTFCTVWFNRFWYAFLSPLQTSHLCERKRNNLGVRVRIFSPARKIAIWIHIDSITVLAQRSATDWYCLCVRYINNGIFAALKKSCCERIGATVEIGPNYPIMVGLVFAADCAWFVKGLKCLKRFLEVSHVWQTWPQRRMKENFLFLKQSEKQHASCYHSNFHASMASPIFNSQFFSISI